MAKQVDPALEAIREKHKEVTGKEAGATLGVKQIAAAIKKFQDDNKDPNEGAEGSGADDPANSSGNGDINQSPIEKVVSNEPVSTPTAPGDFKTGQVLLSQDFNDSVAKNILDGIKNGDNAVVIDTSIVRPPSNFDSMDDYVGQFLNIANKELNMNTVETLGAIKFMSKYDPFDEAAEAYDKLIANLERKIQEDKEANEPLRNPSVNRSPLTDDDLKTEMVTIRNKDGRPDKKVTRVTWDNFLSKAPGGWSLVPEIPAEIRNLK